MKYHPEIEKLGLAKVASYPPKEDNGLIAQLYDYYLPNWRKRWDEVSLDAINVTKKLPAEVIAQIKAMEEASKKSTKFFTYNWSRAEMAMLTIECRVSKRRGDWLFLPADLKV